MTYMIFISTVPNLEEGKKIARLLVEQKIIACCNIIPNVISIYEWEEKIEEDNELLLIIKTKKENSKKLIEIINSIHSYEVSECIGFDITEGSKKYLDWMDKIIKI
ncbi:MAG: divalent-cation tolerance protein CutA [Candidatus Lokiarchaeota archaeon]|nr:divalent-cation tolerance protein CutA [Candidatus Lokiarchaeota archaeon]MCK4281581.1 divalent-cation tolerance protein CutA [Candidatus Lokiarchaeota archaeon]